ncbi:hypothetical protein GTGU_01235 [Trabulsiella guamensis ATCC 49490]|uniref:Phage tail protein n=1 Tax=Trabulsiella guamensis ATCC 49490 TaxID=1005994 RepID=A0A085AFP8_9ENTR|nr:gpW family head-tail joining protein [Trabulsiella guamensis]KFC09043.1 hypothetical protein GTGU_01235 [Trabulsiella guamensis ATCC 49490]
MATMTELLEARNVLHALRLGKQVISVTKDGRRVEYKPADVGDLIRYIATLEEELGISGGRRRGPAGVRL